MEIVHRAEIIGIVIPAAHVRADRGEAFALAEWFQQRVFIEMQVEIVILVELAAERAVEQLDLGVAERGELRRDRDLRGRSCGFRPRGD